MRMNTTVSPFVMVIFGATGDLTGRKLMPALYHLLEQGILPDTFFIVGVARRSFSQDEFREMMKQAVEKSDDRFSDSQVFRRIWEKLEKNIYYQQGFFEDKAPYEALIPRLSQFDKEMASCITRFFYLATPPPNYSDILRHLSDTKLSEGCGSPFAPTYAKATAGKKASGDKEGFTRKWTRVLIEKPFGKDLNEAKKLEDQLSKIFEEKQIYRIDHYLAKETIQNILAFRFANQIEALWNKDIIDHVQITLAEAGGIGRRGKFYEGMGALKDVAQNHLMAMLAYVTMEEPESMTAEHIREKRVEVLSKIRCINEAEIDKYVVRGQYDTYRQEKNVDPASTTETYVAFKLFIDNARWQGVPFYLRTGKRLKESVTRIDIQLKNRNSKLFKQFHSLSAEENAGLISIRVQPKEGISLRIFTKAPGLTYEIKPAQMEFSYSNTFKKEISDSYEKILLDSMMADQTLFATASGFGATWEFITSILNGWEKQRVLVFPNYTAGSWGPKEADELIERDGRKWLV